MNSSSEAQPSVPAVEVRKASKYFGHVTALSGASLRAYAGEVLAVVGDNGAGKSTMVKILAGVHRPDEGEIFVNGEPVNLADPTTARQLGISTVFQDLAVVEALDIAANLFLGQPKRRFGIFADRRGMIAEAAESLRQLKVRLPSVRVPVGVLSGGQRQGVAIARAVHEDNPIILMDEPTAALGVRETAQVADTIMELRARGKAVVLISHDLGFVLDFSDRIQVMRLGTVRAVRSTADVDREEVVGLITGVLPPDPEFAQEQVDA